MKKWLLAIAIFTSAVTTCYTRPISSISLTGNLPVACDSDVVAIGDIIGLIEVMKSFIEVQADAAGTIVKFVVDSEEPVMAGQPLVEVA